MLYAIIGLLVIIADQFIKYWTMSHIMLNSEVIPFIPGILSLVNVHNDGAAFGFLSGSGARIPFIIIAGVFAVVVIIALATKLISGKLARWSIVLVTAGGLSNCLDRVIYGYVQDMFKFEFINFPVFNLADVFITVFAILFALAVIFGKTRKDEDKDEFFDEDEDEDEEEETPKVSRRKQRREEKRRAAAARRKAAEDEDEDEPVPPVTKKPAKRLGRKAADRDAEAAAAEAPAPKADKKQNQPQDDPFADWDRANAKASAAKARASEVIAAARPAAASTAQGSSPARRSGVTQSVQANAQAAAAASAQPSTQTAGAASRPAVSQTARPAAAAPAAPAAVKAPKAAPKAVAEEEFSLDDILNEFK